MRIKQGIIVLIIAIICGLTAALMVSRYITTLRNTTEKTTAPLAQKRNTENVDEPKHSRFSRDIPQGMRAVSVSVNEVSGVSRRIRAGDTVDVIATTAIPNDRSGKLSRIIIESVEVLDVTVQHNQTGRSRITQNKWTVVLLVKPFQAAALIAAEAAGKLNLLVRNPQDKNQAGKKEVFYSGQNGIAAYEPAETHKNDIPLLITHGMRAVTIEVKVTDGVGGILKQGDRVDVMLTSPFDYFSTESGSETTGTAGLVTGIHMASKIIMQDVEILSVDKADGKIPKSVSILVSPANAEKLSVIMDATKKSSIRLISRNPDDHEKISTSGQLLIELLTQKREYSSVDVIRGNRVYKRKFYRNSSTNGNTKHDAENQP